MNQIPDGIAVTRIAADYNGIICDKIEYKIYKPKWDMINR